MEKDDWKFLFRLTVILTAVYGVLLNFVKMFF